MSLARFRAGETLNVIEPGDGDGCVMFLRGPDGTHRCWIHGPRQAHQDAQQGGLAGAVGTDDRVDATARDTQVEVAQCRPSCMALVRRAGLSDVVVTCAGQQTLSRVMATTGC